MKILEPNTTVKLKGGREKMIDTVLARLSRMSRQGASYAHMGKKGWSNPVREDTGPLLTLFAKLKRPRKVLEVGTAHGESMCHIAKGEPDAEFTTIEWLIEMAQEAEANFKEAGLDVQIECGDAMHVIPTLIGPFDLVFMDANKDGYLEQIKLLIERRLLAPHCLVLADNVIDRKTECPKFLEYMDQYGAVTFNTECGLLVAIL